MKLSAIALLSISIAAPYRRISAQAPAVGADATGSQSNSQTVELVREAVASLSEQAQAAHRFTYFELTHTQNRDAKGKLFADQTTLTETTWIADRQFDRIVERNCKPLTGGALAEEQARYDRAVQDRVTLDEAARIRADPHRHSINAPVPYLQLTTRYHLTDLREETLVGQHAHVIDAAPIPSSDPALPTETRHLLLWIAPSATSGTPPTLLRVDFDYITADATPAGTVEPGSTGSIRFTVIDGIPLPEHKEVHAHVLVGGKMIELNVDRTYTRYRQFVSTSTMRAAPPGN
jgi:hypothetical protein